MGHEDQHTIADHSSGYRKKRFKLMLNFKEFELKIFFLSIFNYK